MMLSRTKSKMLMVLVLIGVSVLSGCMFYAKLPEGNVEQIYLSSQEIFRFMSKVDSLTAGMIKEANYRGETVLAKTITQMRELSFELRRKSFNSHSNAVDLSKLERKFNAFDRQITTRVHQSPNDPGMQAIYAYHYQLKREVARFKKLMENSVH